MSPQTDQMAVDVYRNLTEHCLSVRSRELDTYGQVVAHVGHAVVETPEFVVQPAGRQRVREEGRKNVHAFVRGNWVPTADESIPKDARTVTYDPYEFDSFVTCEEELAVKSARHCIVTPDGVTAVGVEFADHESPC